jgi:hypothetical protein
LPFVDGQTIGPDKAVPLMYIVATTDGPTNTSLGGVADDNWPPVMMYDTTLGKPIFLV